MRQARQAKQLEESTLKASMIVAQKKKALDYCTARGNFGTNLGGPLASATNRGMGGVRRVNHFTRRPASQSRVTTTTRSPKRAGEIDRRYGGRQNASF